MLAVERVLAQAIARAGEIVKLDVGLVLELLHEVTVPAQSPGKAAQRISQIPFVRVADRQLGGLVHGA